jgi:hypothetical protein
MKSMSAKHCSLGIEFSGLDDYIVIEFFTEHQANSFDDNMARRIVLNAILKRLLDLIRKECWTRRSYKDQSGLSRLIKRCKSSHTCAAVTGRLCMEGCLLLSWRLLRTSVSHPFRESELVYQDAVVILRKLNTAISMG